VRKQQQHAEKIRRISCGYTVDRIPVIIATPVITEPAMAALSPTERPVEPDPPEASAELEEEGFDSWVDVWAGERSVGVDWLEVVGWVEGVGFDEVEGDEDEAGVAPTDV